MTAKEAIEAQYWIDLLHQSDHIDSHGFAAIQTDNTELLKLLTAIVSAIDIL